MAKLTFSDDVLAIWRQIEGQKHLGIPSRTLESLEDIIQRELGLHPTLMRFGDTYMKWDRPAFLAARAAGGNPDGWFQILYIPQDCERATGSKAHNWTQWAAQLFNYGYDTHPFAPKVRPPDEVVEAMRAAGHMNVKTVFRFLSLDFVVFYLSAQVRTWEEPGRITRIKDFIEKMGMMVKPIKVLPAEPEVDVDTLLDDTATTTTPPKPKIRVPKAGDSLVGYNPSQKASGIEVGDVDDILDADEPEVEEDLIDSLVDADSDQSIAEIEAKIAGLQALLEQRKLAKARERLEAGAAQGQFIDGEVCLDKPEWNIIRIRYPSGNVVTYTRQDDSEG